MLLNDFLSYFKSCKGASERTCVEYKKVIDAMHKWIRANRHDETDELEFYQAVNRHDMVAYFIYCDVELKNSTNTRCIKISAARTFYQFLCEFEYLEHNPCASISRPKKVYPPARYLSLVDSIVLLQSVNKDNRKFYKARNSCILNLFLNCGFRLAELNSIKVSDIVQNRVTVLGKGSRYRTLYLNNSARDTLHHYLSVRPACENDHLIVSIKGNPVSDNAVASIVKRQIMLSGLDPSKISTHKLRHTAATLMFRYGNTDIRVLQSVLGHTSIQSTQIYAHPEPIDLINAVNSNPLAALVV